MLDILHLIPFGEARAISRNKLRIITGLPDRIVRKAIHELRKKHVILYDPIDGGYYRPTKAEVEKIRMFVKIESKRVKSLNENVDVAKAAIKEFESEVM